jgi:succinate-acetate transporter protein
MEFAKQIPHDLFRFAFPTILLSLCNASIFKMNASLLGLAIAHGCLSQLIVSILLLFKGATFRYVVFLSYGAFLWSVVIILATSGIETQGFATPSNPLMRAYLPLLGILIYFWGLCAIRQNHALFWTFLGLWPSFVLESVSHQNGNADTLRTGGLLGLICGCLVLYLGMAELECMELHQTLWSLHLPNLEPIRCPKVQSAGSSVPAPLGEPGTAVLCAGKVGRIKREKKPAAGVVTAQDEHWQDATPIYSPHFG